MRRIALVSFLVVFLTGCSVLCPQGEQELPSDQVEFTSAFDFFQSNQDASELQIFKTTYPDSPWSERAEEVIRYAEQLEQQKEQIARLRQQLKQQKEKGAHQLKTLRASEGKLVADVERLKGENLQLLEKLEQLKGLLIQLEAQPQ